jgi:hypothetical protein
LFLDSALFLFTDVKTGAFYRRRFLFVVILSLTSNCVKICYGMKEGRDENDRITSLT